MVFRTDKPSLPDLRQTGWRRSAAMPLQDIHNSNAKGAAVAPGVKIPSMNSVNPSVGMLRTTGLC
jgi:hypothetical protein